MKSTFNEERFYDEDNRQNKKRVLLIVFLIFAGLVFYLLYSESAGLFPGGYLDKPAVTSYLKKTYGEKCTVKYSSFDSVLNRYVYECSCEKGDFTMEASHYKVRYDGYSGKFLCDSNASADFAGKICSYVTENWANSDVTVSISATADVPAELKDSEFDVLLEKCGHTLRIEVTLEGPEKNFTGYKETVYELLELLRSEIKTAPTVMQVFYVSDGVTLYESHLTGYMFNYNHDGFMNANGVNFYVKLSGDQIKKAQLYTYFKYFIIVCVFAAIVFIVVKRIVRAAKKSS